MRRGLPTGWLGRVSALSILLIGIGILWLGVISPLIGLYSNGVDILAQRSTLANKMAAVAATLPTREAEVVAQEKKMEPVRQLLPGRTDALAGAQLQENLEKTAAATGIVLLSAEAVPSQEVGKLRRIGLKLGMQGTYSALVEFLRDNERGAELLLIDDLTIQGSPIPNDSNPPLLVGLTVYGFRGGEK